MGGPKLALLLLALSVVVGRAQAASILFVTLPGGERMPLGIAAGASPNRASSGYWIGCRRRCLPPPPPAAHHLTFTAPAQPQLPLGSCPPPALRAGMSHHMQSLALARSLAARNHTAHLLLPDYDLAALQKRGRLGDWVTPIAFPTPPGTDDDFQVGRQARRPRAVASS